MGHLKLNRIAAALVFSAVLAVTAPTQAVDSDLYLAGLGLHQETGRDIYLGGIYLDPDVTKPSNLTEATGNRIMEYRVVARRTSIRSLLGGMLLQSEVATGAAPDQFTASFVDDILAVVNTSLYAGDSLEIRLSDDNQTIALLNGHELARADDKSVADYLLMGWVGESGPSTSFRQHITGGDVDPSLLVELEANTYSAEREAEVASWLGEADTALEDSADTPIENEAAEGQQVAQTQTNAEQPADSGSVAATAQQATETNIEAPASNDAASASAPVVSIALAADTEIEAATATGTTGTTGIELATEAESAAAETATDISALNVDSSAIVLDGSAPVQVAALVPRQDTIPANPLEREVAALGIQEYSQRLATFHTQLVRMVYGEIKYPKRAVRRSIEGRMELDVTLAADGSVLNIAIASSSGHQMLDEAAVDAAREALEDGLRTAVDPVAIAEFGSFETDQLTIPVPVAFRLQ